MSEKNVGLFPVNYTLGTGLPGAPTFRLSLLVNTPDKMVNGWGRITQAVNPPLDIRTQVNGTYTYMATMKEVHILVVATGYPAADWPPHAGTGPVLQPNLHLRLVLAKDWASGTAFYQYRDAGDPWVEVNDVPVKLIASEPVQAAA
jgi:hypothetical protein